MKVFTIKLKIMIIALLISVISFGVAAYKSNRWVIDDFEKDFQEKAMLTGDHLVHSLSEGMTDGHRDAIIKSLDFYRKYKDVEELRVFNSKGKEVYASQEGPPETRLDEALRTGRPIHFHKILNERNVAAYIIPMQNQPKCQNCHGKSEPLRGALLLSLSMEEMEQDVQRHRKRFFMLFGLIAAVIGAMTFMASDRLLVKRLKPIQSGAEAIEKGNFGYRIPVESDDEITDLTRYVNRMAERLDLFFRELGDKNRQLTEQVTLVSRSQKEWQETFDCITDPIAVVDQNHSLIRANRVLKETFKEYFPQTGHEAIEQTWSRYFLREFLPHGTDPVRPEDRGSTTQEIHHPGTGRVFEVSLFPYYSSEGSFAGSVVIWKDITEKKEDEMGLIMTERLAALGQMASGIAHELNTPLATIAACNEGLLNRVEKENMGSLLFRSYLKIIEEEIERCKKITTGMLSFVRRSDLEKKEIDVNEVLDKTIDMVSYQGRLREVEILKNVQRMMSKVLGNDGELMQVFLSIVVNALDAMEDKGTLTLETGTIPPVSPLQKGSCENIGILPLTQPSPGRGEGKYTEIQEEISSPSTGEGQGGGENAIFSHLQGGKGGFVFIKIGDTGPGIPSQLINRIFDPFFTTKSEKGGTGLGLSIASKIVKGLNGKIDVTSKEGEGTTFKIILPI